MTHSAAKAGHLCLLQNKRTAPAAAAMLKSGNTGNKNLTCIYSHPTWKSLVLRYEKFHSCE